MLTKIEGGIVALLILIPIFMIAIADGDVQPFAEDPQFDPAQGVDVPTWRVGDYWNYSTSFSISYLGFNIPFSGWMNMSVNFITLDFTHSDAPVYITNITGNVSGFLKIELLGIDEKIYIDLSGYMWERIQDLSMYRMILNATVSGTQSSINGNYPLGYEYNPPLEQYDFPLIVGEEWKVNVSARMPFGSSGDLLNLVQNMSCGSVVQRSVPAGTFDTYPVLSDGTPELFYNKTVGNTVERIFDLEISGLSQVVPWKLEEYHREEEETRIKIWISSEEPVWAEDTFDVSGELTSGNTIVTLMFPGSTIASTVTLVGPITTFTRTLTAPMDMDDTPTLFDHGSFGVLAVVGMLDEYDVCTITTKAVDLMVNNISLMVDSEGNGTKDDNFTAHLKIFDPLNYGVDNLTFQLRFLDGPVVADQVIPRIDARSSFTLDIKLPKMDPTNKTLVLELDPLDQIAEFNETNNVVQYNFTVLERPPLSLVSSQPPGDILAYEGEWVNISAWSYRGEEPVPTGNWTLDGVGIDRDEHFNISISYTGNLSYREEPYIIEYNADPAYIFPGENGSLRWDLTVLNVNLAPEIITFSPDVGTIEMDEDQKVNLSITTVDPDGTPLYIVWMVNGEIVDMNTSILIFRSDHIGINSSEGSPFNVTVLISDLQDPPLNVSHQWNIIVLDVDRPPSINVTPEQGDLEITHNGTITFVILVEDPDGDVANATWSLDGVMSGAGLTFDLSFSDLNIISERYFDLDLVLSVGIYLYEYNWTVHVLPPLEPEDVVPVPPAGVTISSPTEGSEFLTTDVITFKADQVDARPLIFRWLINGSFYEGYEVLISNLSPGNYTAVLNVSTEGPPPGWIEMSISFSVVFPEEHVVEENEKEDPFPWWLVILIVMGAAIVIALILVVALRKQDVWGEE